VALTSVDFNDPKGPLLGIISAAYNLGAICALPFVPWVNDTFGRRWAIFLGSWVMVFGAFIQAFSINGTVSDTLLFDIRSANTNII
jgi:MFS family permease